MGYVGAGSECYKNSECASGMCARANYASGAPYKCCKNSSTTIWFSDYCAGLPKNSPCGTNYMCGKNLNCTGGGSGTLFGLGSGNTCQPCKSCDNNRYCKSYNYSTGETGCIKRGDLNDIVNISKQKCCKSKS